MSSSGDDTEPYGSFKYVKTIPNNDSLEIRAYWIIPDYMKLYKNEEIKYYISPLAVLDDCEWKLKLAIVHNNKKKIVSFNYMFLSPAEDTNIFLKLVELKMFTFDEINWVYDQDPSVIDLNTHVIVKPKTWLKLNKPLMEKDLSFVVDNKICCLKNDSLHVIFKCVVTIEKGYKEDLFQTIATELCHDMENLFLDNTYADVVIKSTDNKEFRVHKAVLANRSMVLKAHFEHNTTESITNIVESHLEAEVLQEVLFFIYTDKAPKVNEIPEKLLGAADYYHLGRLRNLCEEALHKKLTVENSIETLQLADLHSADTLKQQTLEFICGDDDRLKLINKTSGWAKLQSVDLMKMITDGIIKNIKIKTNT